MHQIITGLFLYLVYPRKQINLIDVVPIITFAPKPKTKQTYRKKFVEISLSKKCLYGDWK